MISFPSTSRDVLTFSSSISTIGPIYFPNPLSAIKLSLPMTRIYHNPLEIAWVKKDAPLAFVPVRSGINPAAAEVCGKFREKIIVAGVKRAFLPSLR